MYGLITSVFSFIKRFVLKLAFACVGFLLVSACSTERDDKADVAVIMEAGEPSNELEEELKSASKVSQGKVGAKNIDYFKPVEWMDLIPEDDLKVLMSPPEYIADIEEGSEEDKFSLSIEGALNDAMDDDYMRAMTSTKTVAELDGLAVRIPGFIVPLDMDEEQRVTELFLVPYYGACLHMPPPPPNQMIYAKLERGIKMDTLYDPFWLSGVLSSSVVENDTATSAYQMEVLDYELFDH